ncbi:MAG: adenosylhomocysteinase [Ignavibacteriae bacterium]|nr:adenosylhomocysteinase [Ignavibacteriota bacterium]MCB9216169.1 adenosylhomocysteinase [Ignavibacteria bacterium]
MDHNEGQYKVRDISLAEEGRRRIDWAESRMPVMMALREKYSETKPLAGYRIAGCLHVTKETAVLIRTLKAAGAEVSWSGCNPLSTNDSVAAALAAEGIKIFAWHGLNTEEFYWCIDQTLIINPNLTLDDGADLIFTVHNKYPELCETIIGGTEETTTGVHRLRAMADDGALKYPVIAVNDAETKWDFDNVYGTGQSTLDGILRATSVLFAGKNFVVAGYGHCGRGVAMRAKGMGANVIVTEVKPTAALKATLEGMRVMEMDEAAKVGDIFVTATGVKDVIVGRHFESMKDGAVISNTGHYDCEINIGDLENITSSNKRTIRENNEEYTLPDGRKVYLLAQGRLVNLSAAEGHPSEVMDMSFANQFMSQIRLAEMDKNNEEREGKVYDIPEEQDQEIARLKLGTMGIDIDALTEDQLAYYLDYAAGT